MVRSIFVIFHVKRFGAFPDNVTGFDTSTLRNPMFRTYTVEAKIFFW